MKVKKTILVILIPVLLIALFAVKTLWNAGQFKRISPFSLYRCEPVTGFPGPEDIVIDRSAGMALISFTDRRAAMAGTAHNAGIVSYSLTTTGAKPVRVKTDFKG
ncbi:MAG: hypothetical protein EHM32_10100, partial [Spirochaetales bacterium]